MSELFDVEPGRGMCVVNNSRQDNRGCRDMCDYSFSPMSFTEGAAKGAAAVVEQVRGGGRCPNPNWWLWFIPAVLLCLCCGVGICVVLSGSIKEFIAKRAGKGKRTRASSLQGVASRGADAQEEGDGYEEYGDAGAPPPLPDRPPSRSRDVQIEEYGAGPPPEPHPHHSSYREAPPPAPPPFPEDTQMSAQIGAAQQLFDQIDVNHDGVISRSEYEQYARCASMGLAPPPPMGGSAPPSVGSMRIPGLDEPNLFSNLQNMVGPGSAPQLAPSMEGLGITAPFIPPNSQPQGVSAQAPVFQIAPSYHTQIPPTFASSLPPGPVSSAPNSVQIAPGAVTSGNAGAPFFTQLMRR
jgi:hypothetical protein